jgi:MFS transporter, PHS family, inorganic phosphate transporter
MMAAVFSMQGMGQLVAALVGLTVTLAFRGSFLELHPGDCGSDCQAAADRAWRIIIGVGAMPSLLALYYRMTIPETPRYTFDVKQDFEKGDADIVAFKAGEAEGHPEPLLQAQTKLVTAVTPVQPLPSFSDFIQYFGNWKNSSLLFATMSCWFFLDLAFYGLGLNSHIVLESTGYGTSTESIYQSLYNSAVGSLLIVCAGSLPGYWLSTAFMDTLGRRPIQIWGFAILTALFCIIGFAHHLLTQASLLALCVLAQLFFNFGPNTTTFIVPGECFPTRYSALGHGLSAAAGKVGALIAQYISEILLTKDRPADCRGNSCSPWVPHLMKIFACFMLCGTLISLIIPETKRRTLEEIAGENPLGTQVPTTPGTPRP